MQRPSPHEDYAAYAAALGDACAFCDMASDLDVMRGAAWTWVYAAFPYRKHHTMLVPRRHVVSLAELGTDELLELRAFVAEAERRYAASGLAGEGAPCGQLFFSWRNRLDGDPQKAHAMHLHLHLYPRPTGEPDVTPEDDAADINMAALRDVA